MMSWHWLSVEIKRVQNGLTADRQHTDEGQTCWTDSVNWQLVRKHQFEFRCKGGDGIHDELAFLSGLVLSRENAWRIFSLTVIVLLTS